MATNFVAQHLPPKFNTENTSILKTLNIASRALGKVKGEVKGEVKKYHPKIIAFNGKPKK